MWPSSPTTIRATKTRRRSSATCSTASAIRGAVEVIPDRARRFTGRLAAARPGDCVLIAGKGHETYQIIGDERLPLDDREVAREWLYSEQSAVDSRQ